MLHTIDNIYTKQTHQIILHMHISDATSTANLLHFNLHIHTCVFKSAPTTYTNKSLIKQQPEKENNMMPRYTQSGNKLLGLDETASSLA